LARSRKNWFATLVVCCLLATVGGGRLPLLSQGAPAPDIRLVLLIAVDQFRYDYLTRFRGEYSGGLDRLLRNGANFVNTNIDHYPTVTAIGHSGMVTGALPKLSGIVGNDWYEREEGHNVESIEDKAEKLLGGSPGAAGASPRRLLVSTVSDELKRAHADAKVIGISAKDRGAILPAGHMADGAYWYDSDTGTIASSTYYFPALPSWVQGFNNVVPASEFAGKEWRFGPGAEGLLKMPAAGSKLFEAVYGSPYANEILERFAEEAVRREKLGQRGAMDFLSVSFSANDVVGHAYGPDSPQVHDISLRTDKLLGKLFAFLDESIGLDHIVVAFTADHGVSPVPEVLKENRMPGGRMTSPGLFDPIRAALEARFGPGKWIEGTAGSSPYFNLELIREKKLDREEVERVAAQAAEMIPQVARVYTRTQLLRGQVPDDVISQRVVRSYHPRRSGDLEIVLDPYWIRGERGTTHGTPYRYDTHIPLIFLGPGIRPGRYVRPVALKDLAPTLATLMDVETPSGSEGRALYEMMTAAADR
jgi:hypothetical protein